MVRLAVEIRPLSEAQLASVERHINFDWGNPRKHRERLSRQQWGEATYLVAWHEHNPVGHVFVTWARSDDEPVVSVLDNCPDLQDLFVA